jgi:hypothetical protein
MALLAEVQVEEITVGLTISYLERIPCVHKSRKDERDADNTSNALLFDYLA